MAAIGTLGRLLVEGCPRGALKIRGCSMANVEWRFRKMQKSEMNQDPMEREFFEGEAINTRLVREAIQNSLDAGTSRLPANGNAAEPVRVRFSLAGIHKPLAADMARKYFVGLAPHIDALTEADETISRRAAHGDLAHDGVPYIVIEDAGTVGLDGNWEQYNDSESEPADKNHFYWFFRNVGRSGKGDSDNGSWGLGKWVFPDASHASAYIAVTRRISDDETLLMGQAVLTKHDIDGTRYAPYGYFATFDTDGFQQPMRYSEPSQRSFIDGCISDFGLKYRNDAGLSIIIPFPRIDDEDTRIETPKMIAAIVHNYFYPIVRRKLEVTIDEGDGSPPIEITADTIDDALSQADLDESGERSIEGYRKLFDLCRKSMALADDDYIEMSAQDLAQFGDDNAHIPGLRNR